ncbi:acetyl-CoA carboxylase biotin carboxylase subunit (plasmid) [Haematobacter massiliensis]|nr:acetyl-CoA carboxylase biotin carboxylase subunit [Haematobacter massiliensis]OWJ84736.1 3-methylcrotonyl-CoA carboxylase [Haematobacter massiliensis]QBJ26449.1 acetyl-CoA carboxylase biotin carboxylase subunit [Haematobacter massiliensis]
MTLKPSPFSKLLVANRGEIAMRILRSARERGIATVAVYSDPDADGAPAAFADEAVRIGGAAPRDSYLKIPAIIEAARATGAEAIHPGYGFLAENEAFAAAVREAGLIFVGPSPEAIRAMGDKAGAKALMIAAGVPCVPGYQGEDQTPERLAEEARRIGYPLMIKATAGGGGRGMRLVAKAEEFLPSLTLAKSEARGAFGDDTVLLERAILRPRHIEIQILADRYGHAIHLGERDCSVQRRHQKVVEEAPSPVVTPELRARMGAVSVAAVKAIGYEGAGTLEFLLDAEGNFYFMEMNTRLQVEHPVTEAVTGLDIVALQLSIAAGEPLAIRQQDVRLSGHAIEVRLCAEDPQAGFMPQSGRLARWTVGSGMRVEHALRSGIEVPPYYDSMIAKLIAHGTDRDDARRRLLGGLRGTEALGLRTNLEFLSRCLAHPVFAAGGATTAFIAENEAALLPDTAAAEGEAAVVVAALLRSGLSGSLQHGFVAPLRLAAGERVHELAVRIAPDGAAEVTGGGQTTGLRLIGRDGEGHCRLEMAGRRMTTTLVQDGGRVLLHWQGQGWEFEDRTLHPRVTGGAGASDGRIRASMNGRVVAVQAAVGDRVEAGAAVVVLEAMKMEHAHVTPVAGLVKAVSVARGDQVDAHRVMVEVEAQ